MHTLVRCHVCPGRGRRHGGVHDAPPVWPHVQMAMEETITPRAHRRAPTSRWLTENLTGESTMWVGMRRSRGRHGSSTSSPVETPEVLQKEGFFVTARFSHKTLRSEFIARVGVLLPGRVRYIGSALSWPTASATNGY